MLGEVLKLVRQYHRLDQKSAAEKLDIPASYLSEMERGKKEPTLRVIEKYQNTFDLPSSSLLFIAESLQSGSKKEISSKAIKILKWASE